MPYHCKDCRSYFSVKTNTPMQASNIPMRKWAIGIYLCITSLKSVSSMKLHRDLGISQKAAWFMMMRIREAWACDDDNEPFDGPVEFDETYFGGKRRNKSNAERKKLKGRGAVDMTAVRRSQVPRVQQGRGTGCPLDRQGHAARLRGRSDQPGHRGLHRRRGSLRGHP